MVIFNEKEYIEKIINEHNPLIKHSKKTLINYFVKYYYEEYKDKSLDDYVRVILDTMNSFGFPEIDYREFMFHKDIRKLCKKALKQEINTELRQLEYVEITEAEMTIIAKGNNDRERKLLFTLYVLAKVYRYHSGWVNYPPTEIFKLANISLNFEDRFLLIHKLYKAKLIELNHTIDKDGYKVELHEDSPVAIKVSVNHDFGNQYLAFVRDGWKICEGEDCMKLIKIHAPNQRYCKKCYEKIQKETEAERKRASRNKNVTFLKKS